MPGSPWSCPVRDDRLRGPARRARRKDHYAKLLAAGITSLILFQATLNFFAVLGMVPLTGVPLPFISYGNSNLIVLLGGMGLLLNVAHRVGGPPRASPSARDRGQGTAGIAALRYKANECQES